MGEEEEEIEDDHFFHLYADEQNDAEMDPVKMKNPHWNLFISLQWHMYFFIPQKISSTFLAQLKKFCSIYGNN